MKPKIRKCAFCTVAKHGDPDTVFVTSPDGKTLICGKCIATMVAGIMNWTENLVWEKKNET